MNGAMVRKHASRYFQKCLSIGFGLLFEGTSTSLKQRKSVLARFDFCKTGRDPVCLHQLSSVELEPETSLWFAYITCLFYMLIDLHDMRIEVKPSGLAVLVFFYSCSTSECVRIQRDLLS